jgi:Flp pilus assembly protein TadD
MVGVGLFASVVSFGAPPPEREVVLVPAPAPGVSVSAAELSARAESLFERGEVGEAIEVARRAAAAAPAQSSAWAVLGSRACAR